ncbi:hypothetical protein GCM10009679_70040 [Saccharothrix algeriensis]|uniref:Uncharacterized protein n=1 Tax=Catellatospora bangladeshensis TaxID=310355 RepID=A0A8J3JJP6_9ACTN|nr:hypothetical protein Cba03nite_74400 [Catellatospora bangladeshensis]
MKIASSCPNLSSDHRFRHELAINAVEPPRAAWREPWADPHLLVDTSTGDTPERVARVLGAIRARGAVA